MIHSKTFGLVAVVLLVLLVVNLPNAFTWPLEFDLERLGEKSGNWESEPGRLGAVASESSICSRHGMEMLKKGGNAADAVSLLSWNFTVR